MGGLGLGLGGLGLGLQKWPRPRGRDCSTLRQRPWAASCVAAAKQMVTFFLFIPLTRVIGEHISRPKQPSTRMRQPF